MSAWRQLDNGYWYNDETGAFSPTEENPDPTHTAAPAPTNILDARYALLAKYQNGAVFTGVVTVSSFLVVELA